MIAHITHNTERYMIDLSQALDISIPLQGGTANINAWHLAPPTITPHREKEFVGKVSQGASINVNDIAFNPHAHVTHTEGLGHITEAFHSINQQLTHFFFLAEVVTIAPEPSGTDLVITQKQLREALGTKKPEALVIRTLPNPEEKHSRNYSGSNPPYLLEAAVQYLVQQEIQHLLIDLPSVDKEKDGGALLAHKAFWNSNGRPREGATLTELIYVPDGVADGTYILNLQVAPFENDASPSRPVLYAVIP